MQRIVIAAALALFPLIAQAQPGVYSLTDAQGNVSCVLYDPRASWSPPAGSTLSAIPMPNCVATPSVALPPAPTLCSPGSVTYNGTNLVLCAPDGSKTTQATIAPATVSVAPGP